MEPKSRRDWPEFECVRPGCAWHKILVNDSFTNRPVAEYFKDIAGKRLWRAPLCEGTESERRQLDFADYLNREPR